MKRIGRSAIFLVDHIEEMIVVLCMFGIILLTFAAVLARYVFQIPIAGADQVATYMFLWAALFGASAGFKYNQHGGVSLLADLLPEGKRRLADLAVLIAMAVFFLFLGYFTWQFLERSFRFGQINPATGIPVWTVNAGIFGALTLCGVRCIVAVVRDLAGLPRYAKPPKPANTDAEPRDLASTRTETPASQP